MSVKILKEEIKTYLDKNEQYRNLLFKRGYLLTNSKITDISSYPFYNLWTEHIIGNYYLYVQNSQTVYIREKDGLISIIVGHAYNPFDMKYDENELCLDLLETYKFGMDRYFDKVSEFTGLHIVITVDGEKSNFYRVNLGKKSFAIRMPVLLPVAILEALAKKYILQNIHN